MEPRRGIGILVVVLALAQGRPRGTIAVGDTVRDSLTRRDPVLPAESTYAQEWRLRGRAGETVTIDHAGRVEPCGQRGAGAGAAGGCPRDGPRRSRGRRRARSRGGRCPAGRPRGIPEARPTRSGRPISLAPD